MRFPKTTKIFKKFLDDYTNYEFGEEYQKITSCEKRIAQKGFVKDLQTKILDNIVGKLECDRADRKFEYDPKVIPQSYRPEEIHWSDGYVAGYKKAIELILGVKL